MKRVLFNIIMILTVFLGNSFKSYTQQKSIYDFKVETVDGELFDFKKLKGKKFLIVNVASKCGLTPQYEKLQELYDQFGRDNFEIIAFPSNNFAEQEPGTNKEIKEFCSVNFNISFPIMAKVSVKGEDIAPIYKWLTNKSENGVLNAEVAWNFQKFLIDENGQLIKSIDPKIDPKDDVITKWITNNDLD